MKKAYDGFDKNSKEKIKHGPVPQKQRERVDISLGVRTHPPTRELAVKRRWLEAETMPAAKVCPTQKNLGNGDRRYPNCQS